MFFQTNILAFSSGTDLIAGSGVTPVPEPGVAAMALLGMMLKRRRA